MEIATPESELPSKRAWGGFASRLLEGLSAVRGRYQQQRMTLAVARLYHSDVFADTEAAARRRDAARMRGCSEGFSVIIPEWTLGRYGRN